MRYLKVAATYFEQFPQKYVHTHSRHIYPWGFSRRMLHTYRSRQYNESSVIHNTEVIVFSTAHRSLKPIIFMALKNVVAPFIAILFTLLTPLKLKFVNYLLLNDSLNFVENLDFSHHF